VILSRVFTDSGRAIPWLRVT